MSSSGSFVRWSVACMVLAGLVVFGGGYAGEQVTAREEARLRDDARRLAGTVLQHAERELTGTLTALYRHAADPDLVRAIRTFEETGNYHAQLRIQRSVRDLARQLRWPGEIDIRDSHGVVIASTSDARIGAPRPDFEWLQEIETLPGARLGHADGRLHAGIPLVRSGTALASMEYLVSPQSLQAAADAALLDAAARNGVRVLLALDGDGDTGRHRLLRRRQGDAATWLDGDVPATLTSARYPVSVEVRMPRRSAVQASDQVRETCFLAGLGLIAGAMFFMLLHALAPYFQGMQLLRHVKPRSGGADEELAALEESKGDDRHSPSERMAYDILATHHVLEEVLREHTGELEKLYRVLNKEHRRRDEAEAALKAAEERFHEAVESCMEGVWEWNAEEGLRTWISDSFLVTLGLRRSEFGGAFQDFIAAMHEEDRNPCFAAFQQQVRYGSHFELEYRLRNRKGEWHWFLSRGRLVRKDGRVLRIMGSLQDIQSRKRAEFEVDHLVRELENRAHRDGLTGLHNRTSFLELAGKELKRADRSTQALSVMMLDLDHFKRINDAHGHAVGDQVLREFASTLREELRESDTCARIGGEEFVVLLPETSNLHACRLADRLRARVADHRTSLDGGRQVQFTCSIGVTRLLPGETLEVLLSRADALLYKAKHGGRNRVCSDCGEWQVVSGSDA